MLILLCPYALNALSSMLRRGPTKGKCGALIQDQAVRQRICEALRRLRHMPVDRYLAGYTNSWLAILHEYSDRATYEDDPV